jgi:hypothetical protein
LNSINHALIKRAFTSRKTKYLNPSTVRAYHATVNSILQYGKALSTTPTLSTHSLGTPKPQTFKSQAVKPFHMNDLKIGINLLVEQGKEITVTALTQILGCARVAVYLGLQSLVADGVFTKHRKKAVRGVYDEYQPVHPQEQMEETLFTCTCGRHWQIKQLD